MINTHSPINYFALYYVQR